jgi:hypothetical protein
METTTITLTPWYLKDQDPRLVPVEERVQRGLTWLKSRIPGWETKDYSNVKSVGIAEGCVLWQAVGNEDNFDVAATQLAQDGGLMWNGFNAYSREDDELVVAEWQRVLRAEGVTA